jgi:CSLREA domain-containing protein/uncharacterized repeat protein (TIGR01451 family)
MRTYKTLFGRSTLLSTGILLSSMLSLSAGAATFTVNSTLDSVDANPGDGTCADSVGSCTLRAAVMEANALAGADTIDLSQINDPNNPIILTIKGADESYEPATGNTYQAVATHDAGIGDLNITDSATITGAGSGQTIIEWAAADQADGSADRIFHIEAVTANISVTMSGFTVKNGLTPPVVDIETTGDGKIWQFKRHGGGIAIGTSAATNLFDPSITHGGGGGGGGGGGMGGGHGGEGGGETGFAIDNVTLVDVNVVDCMSGADGGGIFNAAPLTVASSVISGNTATSNGGGIYNSAAMTVVETTIGTMASNSAFSNPNHGENGGGIFDTGLHTTDIRMSAITGNTATGGAALSGRSTTIDNIENTTITGNVARDTAGGLATNGRVMLKNVTVAGNSVVPTSSAESGGAGAGLYSFGSGQFTYVNSIISNNTIVGTTTTLSNCGRAGGAATSGSFFTSSGHNLEDGASCVLTATGDLVNMDPVLSALANNGGLTETMAIPASSPALDAGDDAVCPNNDQRGQLRPADGDLNGSFVCDIGAFELFVHSADVHINNMVAPDSVYASDAFQVSIEAHNDPTATTAATGVVISTDPLPSDFTVTSANVTTPGGTSACSVAGGVVSCAVGSLAVGEAATAVIVGSDAIPGALTITGNVTSATPTDPISGNNTSHVNIQVIGNSDMGITASGGGTVRSGSDTSLNFTVTNHGANDASNVRVAAYLPDGVNYKSVSIDQGSCTYSSDDASVTCLVGNVANGATVSGTLVLTANTRDSRTVVASFGVDADQRDTVPNNDVAEVSLALLFYDKRGGCVYRGGGSFDPTLPAIILVGILGLMVRRTYGGKAAARE